MNPWRPYPLIRLIAAFIAGILSAILHVFESQVSIFLILASVAPVVLLAAFPGFISSYRLRWIRGVMIFAALALAGNQFTLDFLPGYFEEQKEETDLSQGVYIAQISEQPLFRTKTVRLAADIFQYGTIEDSYKFFKRSLVYVQNDPRSRTLGRGDFVLLAGKPDPLPLPAVPGGFDMRSYFGRKGIVAQFYVPGDKWRFLKRADGFSLMRTAGKIRDRLLKILQENNVRGEEFAVSAALLLGYVSEIDKELLSDYSSSGAMHILSVSGMHVGVIYLFLEFVLGLLERRRRSSGIAAWLKALLMVASIWSYAVITGLSPPVQRAAIMLSMVIIGKNMKRQPDILNILAASLFIILLSDPFLVLDVGCQFSYLAVAGIVLLYKPVYDLYVTSKWFPDKVWSLLAVSIAAQLITFPLGLFVFHQFPNYFLLTNILAVPLSSVIIYTGILLLAVGSVPWLGPVTGKVLSLLVWLLNQIVRMIDGLPGSTVKGIFLSMPEMFLVYGIVLALFLFFLKKKKFWLFMLLGVMVLFEASRLEQRISTGNRMEIMVYQGKSANIDFIFGDSHYLLMQDPLKPLDDYTKSALVNLWASRGIVNHFSGYLKTDMRDTTFQNAPKFIHRCGNYFHFCGQTVVVLSKDIYGEPERPFSADLLILTSGVKMKMEELKRFFNAELIVVGGSNAPWKVKEWKRDAAKTGIRVWDMESQGTLLLDIDKQ
jgi:competence protein ComEC